jgi:FixJ family two-component response regulator
MRSAGLSASVYTSPEAFLEQHDTAAPGCVILDLAMPGMDGLDVQRALSAAGCRRPIIFLTGCGDVPTSVQAMKAGAVDFLTKPVQAEDLLAAVRNAIEIDRRARQAEGERQAIRQRLASLTPREREVLDLVIVGRMNKQIAADLGTVEKTVKFHRSRIRAKLGIRALPDLIRMVKKCGGFEPARFNRSGHPAVTGRATIVDRTRGLRPRPMKSNRA